MKHSASRYGIVVNSYRYKCLGGQTGLGCGTQEFIFPAAIPAAINNKTTVRRAMPCRDSGEICVVACRCPERREFTEFVCAATFCMMENDEPSNFPIAGAVGSVAGASSVFAI